MKKLLFFGVIAFLTACSVKVISPTQNDVDRVSGKYPGITLAELSEGKMLFESNCGVCHSLNIPRKKSEKQLTHIVPIMAQKVNKRAGKEVLDSHKQDLVLRYLVTMGKGK
jgi:hypothetical protein